MVRPEVMRAKRLARGLSMRELAERSGWSENGIRNAEVGAHSPCIQMVDDCAAALGISIDEYVGRPVEWPVLPFYEEV